MPAVGHREHRWAAVLIVDLDAEAAAELAGMDLPSRLADPAAVLALGRLAQARGPICSECRVSWRDVHAQPDKPWPCMGARPKALGGPLAPPEQHRTRQQRRAEQRRAAKAAR